MILNEIWQIIYKIILIEIFNEKGERIKTRWSLTQVEKWESMKILKKWGKKSTQNHHDL
jgi:hypothetical protein